MGLLLYFVLLAQDAYRRHLACIYAPLPLLLSSQPTAGVFRAVVVANGVQKLSRDAMGPTFSEEDYDNITGLAGEGDLMEQLGASLAPSIHGHTVIKKGLVQLLAGSLATLRCLAAAASNQLEIAQADWRGIEQHQADFVAALLCLTPSSPAPNNLQLLWQLLEWQHRQPVPASIVVSKACQLLQWCLQQSASHLQPVTTAAMSSLPSARELTVRMQEQPAPFYLVRSLLYDGDQAEIRLCFSAVCRIPQTCS